MIIKNSTIIQKINNYYSRSPYKTIFIVALFVRLIAVFFAKGYGMYDDHFCVIEMANSWCHGTNLPSVGDGSLRNIFYIGFHYTLFSFLNLINISSPQSKMFIVRLIHAVYSLLTIWFGIKIAEELSDNKTAISVGWIISLFWLLPFMSVRNLVEIVCIPPLMAMIYLLIRNDDKIEKKFLFYIFAGLLAGASFVLRYQIASFLGIFGVILLAKKEFKKAFGLLIGYLFFIILTLGVSELILYGKPFATLLAYAAYNADKSNIYGYPTAPWYTYIGTVSGALLPPAGLFIIYGLILQWKKNSGIFFGILAFLILHSIYPNKQERFIFPVIPLILTLGYIGWVNFISSCNINKGMKKIIKVFWIITISLNTILLMVSIFTYSKKTRVEPLTYISNQNDAVGIVFESEDIIPQIPSFYLKNSCPYIIINSLVNDTLIQKQLQTDSIDINYVVMYGDKNISKRETILKKALPNIVLIKTISPSLADWILYKINPSHNVNRVAFIYKTQ